MILVLKSRKVLGVGLVFLTLVLAGCGNGFTDSEEKVKAEMKLLNTYVEDKENPEFDVALNEKLTETMTEEEIAEREVEVDLGIRSNVEGKYETYGINKETKSYVSNSIEKGLAVPKDGKVIEVVNGEEDEEDSNEQDDMTVLMQNQRERLNSMEVMEQTQGEIEETDVNLKILSALRERKGAIEAEIEEKKSMESDGDLGIEKQISELEEELKQLEKNERIGEPGAETEDTEDEETED